MYKLLCILIIILLATISAVQAQESDETAALEIVAELNAWRLESGTWPLKPNPTLTAMAQQQARYLASLAEFPADPHQDSQGQNPRERALREPFNWPYYQQPDQIAIGENAAVGSVAFALNFWRNSSIHSQTALNPAYREVGVAAVPYDNNYLFVAVFGSRPNVLPVLLDPRDDRTIFLSNEQYQYAARNDSIQTVTEVLSFDADGRPLSTEPAAWTNTLVLPEAVSNAVYLLLSDRQRQVISPVSSTDGYAILPGYLPATPLVAVDVPARPVAVEESTSPQVQPPAVASTPDMLIVYTDDTLGVLNVSGQAVDWRDLTFVGVEEFPFNRWSRVADFPLDALPGAHCLQVRSEDISGLVVVPEGCRWVRSLFFLAPDRLFWTQGVFEVRRNGVSLATCQPGVGRCEVTIN